MTVPPIVGIEACKARVVHSAQSHIIDTRDDTSWNEMTMKRRIILHVCDYYASPKGIVIAKVGPKARGNYPRRTHGR